MTNSDIERGLRALNRLLQNIAVSVIGFDDLRFRLCLGPIGYIVHLPEDIRQQLFLLIVE